MTAGIHVGDLQHTLRFMNFVGQELPLENFLLQNLFQRNMLLDRFFSYTLENLLQYF